MAISINWSTKVISVPQNYLTNLGGGVYELDVNQFRLDLKSLEDDEAGMPFLHTHNHNTQVEVGGVTLARVFEIINGYTVTFEDGQYAVKLTGANNNVPDVTNVNQVSIRSGNTAGLTVPGLAKTDQFDGRALSDILVDLLAMVAGKIVEDPVGTFAYFRRDNTTPQFTLVKSDNERLRA